MTRNEYAAAVQPFFLEMKNKALDRYMDTIRAVTFEEWRERFCKAGAAYGDFKPEEIDLEKEFFQEVLDSISYLTFGEIPARQ